MLRLEVEDVRKQGSAQLLGYTFEAQTFETLALAGGSNLINALTQIFLTVPLLIVGPNGFLEVVLFLCWLAFILLLGWQYWNQYRRWTKLRLDMTNDLVEKMAGQRTRLAQEAPDRWHAGEDRALSTYLSWSGRLDRTAALVEVLPARGWVVVGFIGLLPALFNTSVSGPQLAVGLGAILFGLNPLALLGEGLPDMVGALTAWQQVQPVIKAVKPKNNQTSIAPNFGTMLANENKAEADDKSDHSRHAFFEAEAVSFRYSDRTSYVLENCRLQIERGDRILVEGPSGGGKSTLAGLLGGLHQPHSGRLRLHGVDSQSTGLAGWRERVVIAPQFHENHVLTETFAFNLLMGRSWPPRPSDLREAETLCHELGLGDLLARMPSGLFQMVGETGWQLSHGERSRLYIARSLLQTSDLIVLDESFAALDPKTLNQVLECVLKRAKTLLVIAHP